MARFVLLASTFLPCAWAYIAAVVQHVPPNSAADTPEAIMMANLDGYWNSTTTALRNGAQIIVFPEFGLFSGKFTSNCTAPTAKSGFCFDVPSTNSVFCGSNVVHPVLAKLSCMAAQAGSEAYVSVNICEATEDGNYNTQLVFGGKGQLVAKYRKSHPWMTSCYLKPEQPDLVTFPTSFAGTVGVFTCFDICKSYKLWLTTAINSGYRNSVPFTRTGSCLKRDFNVCL